MWRGCVAQESTKKIKKHEAALCALCVVRDLNQIPILLPNPANILFVSLPTALALGIELVVRLRYRTMREKTSGLVPSPPFR